MWQHLPKGAKLDYNASTSAWTILLPVGCFPAIIQNVGDSLSFRALSIFATMKVCWRYALFRDCDKYYFNNDLPVFIEFCARTRRAFNVPKDGRRMTQQQVLEQNLPSTDVLRMYIGRGHSEYTTDGNGSNSLTVSFLRPTQVRERTSPFPHHAMFIL